MAKVKLSPAAIEDLQQTKAYIANELGNTQAAIRIISAIKNNLSRLATFPEMGPRLSSIAEVDAPYRFLVCGSYTAFYRLEHQTVFVVRILYGKRDFMRILFGSTEQDHTP